MMLLTHALLLVACSSGGDSSSRAVSTSQEQATISVNAPSIAFIGDQRVTPGRRYFMQPRLQARGKAIWRKAYGPDAVSVHPLTGAVSWDIPADLPQESFHLGVRATNNAGTAEETWVVTIGDGDIIYVGPGEVNRTIAQGLAAMKSGDTLILRDGTWTSRGKENTIAGNSIKHQQPPGGSPDAWTTVIAENPGRVVIDGQHRTKQLIYINGNYAPPDFEFRGKARDPRNYIAIKGLTLKNAAEGALRVDYAHHIKLIDMGVGDVQRKAGQSSASVYLFRTDMTLLEGFHAWGHSRYKIQFRDSTNGVARRAVIRSDTHLGKEPIGGAQAYCSRNILFQNIIAIDSDHHEFWPQYSNIQNLFGVPATGCPEYPTGNIFESSIGLNADLGLMQTDAEKAPSPTHFENLIGWDLRPARYQHGEGGHARVLHGRGLSISDQITIGRVNVTPGYNLGGGRGFFYSRKRDSILRNSLLVDLGWNGSAVVDQGPLAWSNDEDMIIEHNLIDGFAGNLAGDGGNEVLRNNLMTGSAGLRYLPRLEPDSPWRNAGAGGKRLGAEVMTLVGESGSFYGQPGARRDTGLPLWPFPNETRIADNFRDWRYHGPEGRLNGARGFASPGQSLSHYIWGYLGNTPPPLGVVAAGTARGEITVRWLPPPSIGLARLSGWRVWREVKGKWTLAAEVSAAEFPEALLSGLPPNSIQRLQVTAMDRRSGESGAVGSIRVRAGK